MTTTCSTQLSKLQGEIGADLALSSYEVRQILELKTNNNTRDFERLRATKEQEP